LKKIFTFLVAVLFLLQTNSAQKITGTWQGVMGNEYLQLNIIQQGSTICGYSRDWLKNNPQDYCKANFNGSLSTTGTFWFAYGTNFIENSGNHILMKIKFKAFKSKGVYYLQGFSQAKSTFFDMPGSEEEFILKRVSSEPTSITPEMEACFPKIVKKKKPLVAPSKPKKEPVVIKKPVEEKEIIKPIIIPQKPVVVLPKIDSSSKKIINTIPVKTNGRLNKEQSRIVIKDKKINIEIYDNGTIDGDTVSVFFDGKEVVHKQKLSINPIKLSFNLDANIVLHSVVLFAENLGSIPPNTALVIVTTASGKRFELSSSATLNQNAALIFEYKPD
jgi:hypothetical protein